MNNPFEILEKRLSNIESLLIDIKHKTIDEKQEINFNIDEVAELLRVSKQSIYKYIQKGLIKAKKVGRTFIISKTDLDEATKEAKSLKYQRNS